MCTTLRDCPHHAHSVVSSPHSVYAVHHYKRKEGRGRTGEREREGKEEERALGGGEHKTRNHSTRNRMPHPTIMFFFLLSLFMLINNLSFHFQWIKHEAKDDIYASQDHMGWIIYALLICAYVPLSMATPARGPVTVEIVERAKSLTLLCCSFVTISFIVKFYSDIDNVQLRIGTSHRCSKTSDMSMLREVKRVRCIEVSRSDGTRSSSTPRYMGTSVDITDFLMRGIYSITVDVIVDGGIMLRKESKVVALDLSNVFITDRQVHASPNDDSGFVLS